MELTPATQAVFVPLLPRCSCPDVADPCKHSAAVCYLVADAVDADPFVLFLLRGRGRDEVLHELRARRRGSGAPVRPPEPGLIPRAAFARRPAPVPALPPAPRRPAALVGAPPLGSALSADVLTELAADAAVRAFELLNRGLSEPPLSMEEDLARRAARGDVAQLAASARMPPRESARWAVAWREAGRGGLAVLRESWQPPRGALAQARAELDEAELPGGTKVWRNRLTRGDVQLRLGRDLGWYLFRPGSDGWLPAASGALTPLDTLS